MITKETIDRTVLNTIAENCVSDYQWVYENEPSDERSASNAFLVVAEVGAIMQLRDKLYEEIEKNDELKIFATPCAGIKLTSDICEDDGR